MILDTEFMTRRCCHTNRRASKGLELPSSLIGVSWSVKMLKYKVQEEKPESETEYRLNQDHENAACHTQPHKSFLTRGPLKLSFDLLATFVVLNCCLRRRRTQTTNRRVARDFHGS